MATKKQEAKSTSEADATKAGEETAAAAEADATQTDDGPTKADIAKYAGLKVRLPATDKDGKPVVDKGVYAMTERKATADDILSFRLTDTQLIVVTIDGRKHTLDR